MYLCSLLYLPRIKDLVLKSILDPGCPNQCETLLHALVDLAHKLRPKRQIKNNWNTRNFKPLCHHHTCSQYSGWQIQGQVKMQWIVPEYFVGDILCWGFIIFPLTSVMIFYQLVWWQPVWWSCDQEQECGDQAEQTGRCVRPSWADVDFKILKLILTKSARPSWADVVDFKILRLILTKSACLSWKNNKQKSLFSSKQHRVDRTK